MVLQNGYWVSVCWCALLMPVVLCVSARLARLYRRAEPYPGPLVEAYVTPCSSFPLPSVSGLLRIGTRLVNIAVRLTHTVEVPMRRVGAGLRWRRPRPASRLIISNRTSNQNHSPDIFIVCLLGAIAVWSRCLNKLKKIKLAMVPFMFRYVL